MLERRDFYINGAWVAPAAPRDCAVIDPSTEEACAIISLGDQADTDAAVAAAKAAFPAWNPAAKSVDFGFSANSDANGYTLTASGASGKLSGCTLTLAQDGTTGDAGCLAGW